MQLIAQQNVLLKVVLVLIAALAPMVHAESFKSTIIYLGRYCSGTPLVVSVINSADCAVVVKCVVFTADGVTYSFVTACKSTDRQTYVAGAFANSSYIMIETFTKLCKYFLGSNAYLATGECQVYDDQGSNYFIAKVNEDGSAILDIYDDSSCTGTPLLGYTPDSDTVSSHSCYKNYSVIYTGDATDNQATTGLVSATSIGSISHSTVSTQQSGSGGSYHVNSRAGDNSDGDIGTVGNPTDNGSDDGRNATVVITPSESSGGINTGAIIGIVVAYIILSAAAVILCMDRIERLLRRLGLRS